MPRYQNGRFLKIEKPFLCFLFLLFAFPAVGWCEDGFSVKISSAQEIEFVEGKDFRFAEDIVKDVESNIPGLYSLYSKYRKKRPELSGTVTFRLTLNLDGGVAEITTVSSTTEFKAFDDSVKNAVKRWRFQKIEKGKAIVEIPFTFSM